MNTLFNKLTIIALVLLLSVSCSKEVREKGDTPVGNQEQATVILRLKMPEAFGAPGTRTTIPGSDWENTINTVHVFAFRGYGDNLALHHVTKATSVTPVPGATNTVTFTAELPASKSLGDSYRLMVIANAETLIEDDFGATHKGKSYEEIRGLLQLSAADKLFHDPNHNHPAGSTTPGSIPMWGMTSFLEVRPNISIPPMTLIRSVARIDIGVGRITTPPDAATQTWNGKQSDGVTDVNFKLQEVYVAHYNNHYGVMPRLEALSRDRTKVTTLSLIGNRLDETWWKDYFHYKGSDIKDDAEHGNSIQRLIYIPEADVRMTANAKYGDAKHKERAALVVGGIYGNDQAISYYRIDFIDDKGNLENVLRNHCYRFSIGYVGGPGESSPEAAYASTAPNVQMTATISGWEDGWTNEKEKKIEIQ